MHWNSRASKWDLWVCLVLFCLDATPVSGQYIQSFQIREDPYRKWYTWRKLPGGPEEEVLVPNPLPILEYNCYFMPAICQNVMNWMNKDSGQPWGANRNRPHSSLFAYDMTGNEPSKPTVKRSFNDVRRSQQCPNPTWRETNRCPAAGQPPVMPGPWITTELEPNPLQANEIKAMRLPGRFGNTSLRSGRYYR
jgi:hypothetical protein